MRGNGGTPAICDAYGGCCRGAFSITATRRLYGPPVSVRVVSAFAMFVAMVSMRTRCAESPLAAMPRVRNIGFTSGRSGEGRKPRNGGTVIGSTVLQAGANALVGLLEKLRRRFEAKLLVREAHHFRLDVHVAACRAAGRLAGLRQREAARRQYGRLRHAARDHASALAADVQSFLQCGSRSNPSNESEGHLSLTR